MQHVETERRNMMQNYPDFYPLAATAVLIGVGIVIGWMLFADHESYGMNLFTEVLSIGVTVLVIDRLNRRRAIQQRKEELIQQLGSYSNDFALEAVRLLHPLGALTDGSLQKSGIELFRAKLSNADLNGASLSGVNLNYAELMNTDLQGCDLRGAKLLQANLSNANLFSTKLCRALMKDANLSSAYLWLADLSGANLSHANLTNAILFQANLTNTILWNANLSNANLSKASLCKVFLRDADLRGADLFNAHLSGAELKYAAFDKTTILPDGTYWIPNTDLRRFTDPNYPDYFSPPAYPGVID